MDTAIYRICDNNDVIGLKAFFNEWLVNRQLNNVYGVIETNEETSYIRSNDSYPVAYQNDQYLKWLKNVYFILSKERNSDPGLFYWFKPFKRAKEILRDRELHLLSLDKMDQNDHTESIEFIQRYHSFPYAEDYAKSRIYGSGRIGTHISCFTTNFRKQRFWEEYANYDTGVCIGLRIVFKNDSEFSCFQPFKLRDIFYDKDYSLDFLNEIRYEVFKHFNVVLSTITEDTEWMPYYYKRDKYRWEEETRLSFDIGKFIEMQKSFSKKDKITIDERLEVHNLELVYETEKSEKPPFLLRIPFDNAFIKVEVCEIICGSNVLDSQISELKDLINANVIVWKR